MHVRRHAVRPAARGALAGALYFYVEGVEPWVAEAPPARALAPMIMPGVGHLLEFHGVVRSSCWAAVVGDAPVRPEAGDIILFSQGDRHVLSSAPGMRSESMDMSSFFTQRPKTLPFAVSYGERGVTTARLDGGGGAQTTIVCGFLGTDERRSRDAERT